MKSAVQFAGLDLAGMTMEICIPADDQKAIQISGHKPDENGRGRPQGRQIKDGGKDRREIYYENKEKLVCGNVGSGTVIGNGSVRLRHVVRSIQREIC
jgi:hypothetical protein